MADVAIPAKVWQEGQRKETEEEKRIRKETNDQMLALPYAAKVSLARTRIIDWRDTCAVYGKDYAVSVGGLDSITLLALVRDTLESDAKGVSVSILEDKSIQRVHQEMGVISIKPLKTKVQVIQEFGFPVISKMVSAKIARLQVPGDDSPIIKAYMTGEEGAWGGYKTNKRFKLPDKWVELFGGLYKDFRPDLSCKVAPFKVSDQCCFWLKEEPMRRYQEEMNFWPFLGLMQSEGGRRQYSLRMHGCNYVGKDTSRSCPFNFFSRQDLLQLAQDLHVHVPEIYGEIVRDENGQLRTTKAQRTGCSMCGYGIHLDKRPHHFDLLYEQNPKEWKYWMYDVGWGKVLDYIGVGWRPETRYRQKGRKRLTSIQLSMFDEEALT